MDTLIELVYVVNKNIPRSFENLLPKDSKIRQLFDAILKEKIKDDEEAAAFIYQTRSSDKKYLMLKNNLKKRLTEILLLSEHNEDEGSENIKNKFSFRKKLVITELLLMENVFHNSEKILLKLRQEAENLQLLDIEIECLKQLRTLYCLKGVPKENEKYDQKLKKAINRAEYELKVQGMWENIMSKRKYLLTYNTEIVEDALKYYKEAGVYKKEVKSNTLFIYYLRIELAIYSYYQNHAQVTETLAELNKILGHNQHLNNYLLSVELLAEEATHYRNTADMSKALKTVHNALEMSSYKAFTRFDIQNLHFDILLKCNELEKACQVLHEVKNCRQYPLLDPSDKAAWLIREAYLYFLLKTYQLYPLIEKYTPYFTKKHALMLFEDDCRPIQKDKTGYHLMFIVAGIIINIQKKEYDLEAEANNLMVYYQRYIKDMVWEKTQYFLKSLSKIAKMHPSEYKKFDEKDKIIHTFEKKYNTIYDPCEIVPYLQIMNIILGE
ncbi:MAG: hypothetical protein NW207_11150 [Cytophagales bacterium]|nr:hypothetical protein [Cytophagales bacterium]